MKGQLEPYDIFNVKDAGCAVPRCKGVSVAQWRTCASGGRWMAVCRQHDLDLNALVLTFFGFRTAQKMVERYDKSPSFGSRLPA